MSVNLIVATILRGNPGGIVARPPEEEDELRLWDLLKQLQIIQAPSSETTLRLRMRVAVSVRSQSLQYAFRFV